MKLVEREAEARRVAEDTNDAVERVGKLSRECLHIPHYRLLVGHDRLPSVPIPFRSDGRSFGPLPSISPRRRRADASANASKPLDPGKKPFGCGQMWRVDHAPSVTERRSAAVLRHGQDSAGLLDLFW